MLLSWGEPSLPRWPLAGHAIHHDAETPDTPAPPPDEDLPAEEVASDDECGGDGERGDPE